MDFSGGQNANDAPSAAFFQVVAVASNTMLRWNRSIARVTSIRPLRANWSACSIAP
jgi:hypothetical protein